MIKKDMATSQDEDEIKIFATIDSTNYGCNELWFSLSAKYKEYIFDSQMDAFVLGMLYPAMEYGEDIHVEDSVSEKLLFNLNNYAIPLLLDFSRDLKKIKIPSDGISDKVYKMS